MPREDLQVPEPLKAKAQYVEDSSEKVSSLALTEKGNIGIATDQPESQLHVKGDIRVARGDKLILGDDGQGVGEWIQNATARGFGIVFFGKGRERARITNNGRVGVATDRPESKLHVKGDIRVARGDKLILGDRGQGVGEWIQNVASGGFGIVFFAGGRERARITSDGRVGIGTTDPKGALDVDSTTGALVVPRLTDKEIRVLPPQVDGSIVYNTSRKKFLFHEAGSWVTYRV